jgi:hypothetical protein
MPIAAAPLATNPPATLTIALSATNAAQEVPEDTQGERGRSYLLFGVLAGGLTAGLIALKVRRRL